MTFNLMPVLFGMMALLPWFGPEVEPAPPRRDVNPTGHFGAVIAANGSGQMLVAYRDGRGNDSITSTGDNLRFTRVTPEGALLDPGGIQMVVSGPSRDYPALATDGTDYLVAWAEHTTYEESHLRVARIGADGTVLQAPAVVSSSPGTAVYSPKVCWDGLQYRMVFTVQQNSTLTNTLYTVRLTTAGAPVAPPAVIPVTAGTRARGPAIACHGADGLVAWLESTVTGAEARVAPWPASGEPGPSSGITLPGAKRVEGVGLAAGPAGFFAAWDEERAPATGLSLVGQVLDAKGARTSSADVTLAPAATSNHFPDVAFDGSAWRVLARQLVGTLEQVYLGSVATDGTVTRPLTALTSDAQKNYHSGLACFSGTCLASWSVGTSGPYLAATRVDATGRALDVPPMHLSLPSDEQGTPRLTWDGEQLLVSWTAVVGRSSPAELVVRRQDGRGVWLDAAPLVIGRTSSWPYVVTAMPEGGFALAYISPSLAEIVPAFVSRTGELTQGPPLARASSARVFSLACLPNECHIFGSLFGPSGDSDVAFRVDRRGNSLNGPGAALRCDSALAFEGEVWCVTDSQSFSRELTLRRFDASLTALGSPLLLSQPNESLSHGPAMLAEFRAVTLVWSALYEDPVSRQRTPRAKVVRLRVADQMIDGPRDLPNPSLLPDGLIRARDENWLFWYASDGTTGYRLLMQQLSAGLTLEGPVTEVTAGGFQMMSARANAVARADGEVIVSYLRLDNVSDRGSHRVKLRLTAPPPDGGIDAGADGDAGTSSPPDASDAGTSSPPDANDASSVLDAEADVRVAEADVGPDVPPADARPDVLVEPRPDATADAQVGGTPQPDPTGGCGCRTARGGHAALGWLGLLVAAVSVRARRRAATDPRNAG